MANGSNTTAPTQFIQTKLEKYAYRRFGKGQGLPLLCLQHFTGTLDNWDPAVTDPLALGREVILFESAGLGRSTGQVPENMAGMAAHALAFVDALGLKRLDILGYSLGGMVAQHVALDRASLVHKMLLVATAARREKARWRASGRPRCRNRSDHGLSRLGKVQWRTLRQARQDHAAVPGR